MLKINENCSISKTQSFIHKLRKLSFHITKSIDYFKKDSKQGKGFAHKNGKEILPYPSATHKDFFREQSTYIKRKQ
jgi:hypothetical protein